MSKSSKSNGESKKAEKTKSQGSTSSSQSQTSNKSLGMGPSLRMTSTDIRELTKETQSVGQSAKLTAEGGSPPGESVYDSIAYIIFCPSHEKIAIGRSDKDKTSWLPFIACPSNRTWKDASIDGVSVIFNKQDAELDAKLGTKIPIKEMHCLHVFRTQLPAKQSYITLVIQLVILGANTQTFKCCQNTKRIQWIPLKDAISGNIEKVWGPEVQDFAKCAKNIKPTGLTEHSLEEAFLYVCNKVEPKTAEEQLVKGAGIGPAEAELLYVDYIEHCFPSLCMSLDSFKEYVTKYFDNFEKNDAKLIHAYNAFNFAKNNGINFHEFLLGLSAMEPSAPNGDARSKFVFRYYDIDGNGKLTEQEFRKLVKDMSVGSDDSKIDAKVKEAFGAMGAKDFIDLETFTKGVNDKKIRGTSGLCRAPKPVFKQITQSQTNLTEKKTAVKKKAGFLMQNRRNKGTCFACRGKKYDYGLHSIKLDTTGRCVEPRRIFEPDSVGEAMSQQKYSIEYTFNTRSIGNSFVDLIRDFSRKMGTAKDPKGFMSSDKETLVKYIQVLSGDLESIISSDDRVVKLNSPTFVFGDIYGNLADLLTFEKHLWQSFPVISAHYLFLGNYVDQVISNPNDNFQGKWGLEVALYLFALKLIYPTKFVLLRGNHESRDQQKKSTFLKECTNKYGTKTGTCIWELINSLFDKLPVASIIDESIFCSHSGIPKSVAKVDDISSVSCDLKEPEKNGIAIELMNGEVNEGDVRQFLKSNGFSHMIRSNQMTNNGFNLQFGGKCLTIFSSSHFCGNKNESVAVFLDTDKIRIIQLDTSKNPPATDPK